MGVTFRTVALIGRYQSRGVAGSLLELASFVQQQGARVVLESETARNIGAVGHEVADFTAIGAAADLAVVMGGDGTMLSAARQLARHNVPLVGVNQGRLGFMTDIALSSMFDGMSAILAGNYIGEQRRLLEAEVSRAGVSLWHGYALNDVVVNKGATGRMIEFQVHIDGEFVYDQSSDGLIVATATGSTAYALSANGPILHPKLAGIALVPLCPHALTNRPIAVSDECVIEIVLQTGLDARANCDGQLACELSPRDKVTIRRSQHAIRFLHPPGYSYYAMLREKLHWSEAPKAQ